MSKKPKIIIIGNEKGGAGKTTCSMHLIIGLLDKGYRVSSIDVDSRQHSLTRYIENRKAYIENHKAKIPCPNHFLVGTSNENDLTKREDSEKKNFEAALSQASKESDFVIIDTPGSYSFLSKLAHSYADIVITPINDSFIDLDVMAKVDEEGKVVAPSIYSQMIWDQKMERAKRDGESIEWFALRNRLTSLDARNKRNVNNALSELSRRIGFKVISGFSERVIFKELFLQGLTLLDLKKIDYDRPFTMSHVAARQELRDFLDEIGVDEMMKDTEGEVA